MIDQPPWHVEILPSARRKLMNLRSPIQTRVRAAIRALADDPTPANSIAMRGKGTGLAAKTRASGTSFSPFKSGETFVFLLRRL